MLPVFNHPLKIAGELGMLDAISNGRLEVGFARAFLPHEFARFGISLDESRDRFTEGMEQVRLLLEEENVTSEGRFHSFRDTTSLPRPTQKPRPPFWVAAPCRRRAFRDRQGRPCDHGDPARREAHEGADRALPQRVARGGPPGKGRVMLAFHMFCHEDRDTGLAHRARADEPLSPLDRRGGVGLGTVNSKDYAGYDKMIEMLSKETIETQVESGAAWIGTPDDIAVADRALRPRHRRLRERLAAGEFQHRRLRGRRALGAALQRKSDAALPRPVKQ